MSAPGQGRAGERQGWCPADDCPTSVCGGVHREVLTSLGVEIVRDGHPPIGVLVTLAPIRPEETTMPTDTAAAGGERLDIDALMHEHWLTIDLRVGRWWVTGCHCGFKADLDSDCGYGDSVVRHLFEIATAAPAAVEVREEWGVRYRLYQTGERDRHVDCADEATARATAADFLSASECSLAIARHRTVIHGETPWRDVTTRWEPQP